MLTHSTTFSVFTIGLVSGLGTLTLGSSALAATFPFPLTYGDVSSTTTQTLITNAFSNGLDDLGNFNVSGNNPIFAFELELELGLADGALGFDAGDTSAIAQTLTAKQGDTIRFDWTFLTNHLNPETIRNDYAFLIVNDLVIPLADTNSVLTAPGLNGFARQTSNTFSYVFPTDGLYQIALGVSDVGDETTSSALLVENFDVQSVPEPSTLLGLGTTLLLGLYLKRKRKA
ncbi:protein of unknown function DUF1555 [Rippkaea orientalis PCC 8801]|uniref:Ice-binding protein C-terminal domain-containing protein n=1 Tax=Rippkaea orientalis (strain PCC 8801 / RF-1) TaxID=41431 RepID=B7JYH2_RIPO1|nr:PEP-CTERM sorting domain-containing protein [Rippkaea orientalis]ACK64842.1 protein of unknown function DUF1555 [Rippkaea orientalis PCC 8801]